MKRTAGGGVRRFVTWGSLGLLVVAWAVLPLATTHADQPDDSPAP